MGLCCLHVSPVLAVACWPPRRLPLPLLLQPRLHPPPGQTTGRTGEGGGHAAGCPQAPGAAGRKGREQAVSSAVVGLLGSQRMPLTRTLCMHCPWLPGPTLRLVMVLHCGGMEGREDMATIGPREQHGMWSAPSGTLQAHSKNSAPTNAPEEAGSP